MARQPKFTFKKTASGWKVEVPSSLSPTGKRQRFFYATRDEAKREAAKLREKHLESGARASVLSPTASGDAVEALDLLTGHSVTLRQAALFWLEHHDKRSNALALGEAWDRAAAAREELSDRYKRDFEEWKRRLPDALLATNACDLTGRAIEDALKATTGGATMFEAGLRMLTVVLNDEVRAGRLEANPCKQVSRPRRRKTDEVTIYTPEQLKKLFDACRHYDTGLYADCRGCLAPFAILAFAGVRPAEVGRLLWEEIDLEEGLIRLNSKKTKTRRLRNVRIRPTLKAWLQTVPPEKRTGPVCPGTWIRKAWRVRREAGLDGRKLQDALRHSFGSYLLAYEGDRAALENDMGHQHVDTFFRHYHRHVTKKQALQYWQVLPEGVKLQTIKAA